MDVFTGMITIEGILTVLVGAAAIGLVFVGFWWGVRRAQKTIFGAFRKGRLHS
jgi:FtsZ-interacting cell division protein ZipA